MGATNRPLSTQPGRPQGMALALWTRISKLPTDLRDRVLERSAILIFEAGVDPAVADEAALVLEGVDIPRLPGVEP